VDLPKGCHIDDKPALHLALQQPFVCLVDLLNPEQGTRRTASGNTHRQQFSFGEKRWSVWIHGRAIGRSAAVRTFPGYCSMQAFRERGRAYCLRVVYFSLLAPMQTKTAILSCAPRLCRPCRVPQLTTTSPGFKRTSVTRMFAGFRSAAPMGARVIYEHVCRCAENYTRPCHCLGERRGMG